MGGEAPRPPRAEAEPAIRSAREPRAGGAIQSSPPPAPPDRGRGMDTSASRATRKRPPGEHRPLQVGDLPTSATALDPTTGAACHAPPPIPREEVVSEASPSSRSPASHLTRNRSQRSSNRARLSSPGSPAAWSKCDVTSECVQTVPTKSTLVGTMCKKFWSGFFFQFLRHHCVGFTFISLNRAQMGNPNPNQGCESCF